MNPPNSAAGMQAQWLAEEIAKHTSGGIKVTVYPSSQLGKLQELAEAVSTGTIALSHNTAGGIGSLHEPFAALDTPYLYRDVDHLMKVMDVDSPVMKKLNDGLIKDAGVRVLYAYYFGTRQLTTNKAVKQPSDLAGPEDPRDSVPDLHDDGRGDGCRAGAGGLVRSADRAGHRQGQRPGEPGQRRAVVQALRDAVAPDADRPHHERAGHRHQREGLAEAWRRRSASSSPPPPPRCAARPPRWCAARKPRRPKS